ncbi:DNA helicase/exodeoxyribonuclease V, alpha subunit [Nocardioides terrae]|uniref:RecBCD enzyme subunit RecD n=1 Tax=Nocardioides terrae TaxID=574651 RepID=A0A1I1EZN0_9ACTN|nr:exodeoxyribonuclease V subunit alpha [Nocardioides terrae]SFB92659.1 DNA helicase/exodeoxyribonuclease V, alpha subunit [Nocardioides terrae]
MIERWESDDPRDARLALGATGLLRDFNRAGALTAADVHVATRTAELVGESADDVRLAVALAVRAARLGSVCVDLSALPAQDATLPWPTVDGWLDRVSASPLVAGSVVQVDRGLLYLDRYHREEGQVRDDLLARLAAAPPAIDDPALAEAAERLFPGEGYAEQRAAALAAARQWTTVLTGGPGTGKTTTVAGLLALVAGQSDRPLRIALTAPTGKAAARLQEAVEDAQRADRFSDDDRQRLGRPQASTLHRLLGWRPGSSTRFKHHRGNKLPHDVIVVDETSMVSLTMMARLIEAVRPDARLVLVGDPDQLASVEAGALLSDLVTGLAVRAPATVAGLQTTHRFGEAIGGLAAALRDEDADLVLGLLTAGDPALELVDPGDADAMAALQADLTHHATTVRDAALTGDAAGAVAAADAHRLLCAHREGPWGAAHWNRQVERWLGEATGVRVGAAWGQEWYAGRPILITANDYGLDVFNGDTGVTVQTGETLTAFVPGAQLRTFAPSRLGDVETLHAMTVHKSQGSQARVVTVLLPPEDSPLLTLELFYTAVTRAQERVRVVGTPASVRAAIGRRALRATGLRQRLADGSPSVPPAGSEPLDATP